MGWILSTQLQKDLLAGDITISENIISDALTFTSNKITAGTALFGNIKENDWVLVGGSSANKNIYARVLTATTTELTFGAGTFTAEASGTDTVLLTFAKGCIKDLFKNSVLVLRTGSRPADADALETGDVLAEITKDGGTFVANAPENGINTRLVVDSGVVSLKRAMKLDDPATPEVLQGVGLAGGTAGWGRWYLNDKSTGASTSASRMDGTVTTSTGGDIVMANGRDVAVGAPVTITDISMKISGV